MDRLEESLVCLVMVTRLMLTGAPAFRTWRKYKKVFYMPDCLTFE